MTNIQDILEYNTSRVKLIMPEYGRHFQKILSQICKIEDREERTRAAFYIAKMLGDMNPHLRDIPDFQHKLWDQLYMISDCKLDIDFPDNRVRSEEKMKIIPNKIPYPQQKPKYRFYGNNIKAMIDEAIKWEDGDKKEGLILAIANHMKKCYLNWNNKEVEDSVIFEHLKELSNGQIDLEKSSDTLSSTENLIKVTQKQSNKSDFVSHNNQNNNRKNNQNNQNNQNNNKKFVKKNNHSNQTNKNNNNNRKA